MAVLAVQGITAHCWKTVSIWILCSMYWKKIKVTHGLSLLKTCWELGGNHSCCNKGEDDNGQKGELHIDDINEVV